MAMTWLWIPITIAAALGQTVRNAAQKHLTADLGLLGATLVRFLYGLPFAVVWLVVVLGVSGEASPRWRAGFVFWSITAGVAQIVATALLLRVLAMRNFAIGVAYSKTEVVQVALFGFLILGEAVTLPVAISIVLAVGGVMLLAAPAQGGLIRGWTSPTALLGIASGAAFAISAVGYRAAALALAPASAVLAAAGVLVFAQLVQTLLLGTYLSLRQPQVVGAVFRLWRMSLFAGMMGAFASACWFTAMALEPVANVRTVGLIELFFSYVVSQRIFREALTRRELVGMALLAGGLIGVTLSL